MSTLKTELKGSLCYFGGDIQTQTYLYLPLLKKQAVLRGKLRSTERCLKLDRWQGPPNKESKTNP